jgi:predicted amidohydrolase YtcJ
VVGPDERIDPAAALDLFLGRAGAPAVRRRVEPGAPADLCVLDRPLVAIRASLAADEPVRPVVATVVRGSVVAHQ